MIFKILYGGGRLLWWLRQRGRRRLTTAGWTVLGGALLAALTGVDTDNSVGFRIFSVLLFLLLASAVFSFFFPAHFAARRRLPRFATAGRRFSYRVVLRNLTSKPQVGLSVLEGLADERPSFQEWLAVQHADERHLRSFRFGEGRRTNPFRMAITQESAVAPIPSGGETETEVQITPLRRGLLQFTSLTLARPDPLGLVRAFARVTLTQTVMVLPRRYPLPPLSLPGTARYQEGGVAFASSVGQNEEFVALRDYRRGDPLRHIHWRSWAKTGKPIVKEFEDEFFMRHALVLDTFTDDPRSELFEEAVSVAASFACTLLTQESLLDLMFVGTQAYCFTAGRGLAHSDQMLEILASVRTCADQPFRKLENMVLNHAELVSGCVCVLLEWNPERQQLVELLRELNVPVLVLVLAEPDRGRALEPGPLRDQPDRFRVLEMGRIREELARLA